MMFYSIISYLTFLLKSTNKHGIHSPFVYDFITQCLNSETNERAYLQFSLFKKNLLTDKTKVLIKDYGVGSKYFKSNIRPVSNIAKYAGISNYKAHLLIKILNFFKPKSILELGTSVGLSTSLLAQNNQAQITTVEGCKNTSKIAKKYLNEFGYNNISFIINRFSKALPQLTINKNYDLVYFDGNHQKNATLNYFNQCLKAIHNDTIFIFDDIYLNVDMQKAWKKIIAHHKVSISIDIYHYGIVFFRTEQPKQHFYLRTFS